MAAAVRPENPFQEWLARYRDDPVLFVREVLGAEPEWHQAEMLTEIAKGTRRISIVSGHGVGKTTGLAWAIVWWCATRFPQKCVCTAPTSAQLFDALANETKTWLGRLPPFVKGLFDVKAERIELSAAPEESFASFRTSRPDTPEALAGVHAEHVLLICDEASGIPEQVYQAAIGSMSGESATTVLAGNGIRSSGLFWDTHNKPGVLTDWYRIRVNAEDSPRCSRDFIREVITRYGQDSNAYRVRVLGLFPKADDDTLIPFELKEAALRRDVRPSPVTPIWGLDCARFGSDRTALAKRQGNTLLEPVQSWHGKDTMEVCGLVKAQWDAIPRFSERPEEICVDAIGLGAGVADRLREMGLPARDINVSESPALKERFLNLRAELWWEAREWFAGLACNLGGDDALGAELVAVKYRYSSSGKIQVEGKEDMKKRTGGSPDLADAFVLTFAGMAVSAAFGSDKASGTRTSWREPLRRRLAGIV